ncbi:methyltransferase domain-containing protein [Chryseobacterium sp. 3008163]|uniref:methyltransferase domain-containing protein n=1 Tax=Chryseobacterium sp. 3008163 TaxID=2478663 RepID=UPI003977306B
MVEPVSKHIKIAQHRNHKSRKKFVIHQGESQNLDFQDNYADLIILHGPLYHLQNEKDRSLAILEAKRILKKMGLYWVSPLITPHPL